jgi:hypothetical protein
MGLNADRRQIRRPEVKRDGVSRHIDDTATVQRNGVVQDNARRSKITRCDLIGEIKALAARSPGIGRIAPDIVGQPEG